MEKIIFAAFVFLGIALLNKKETNSRLLPIPAQTQLKAQFQPCIWPKCSGFKSI